MIIIYLLLIIVSLSNNEMNAKNKNIITNKLVLEWKTILAINVVISPPIPAKKK